MFFLLRSNCPNTWINISWSKNNL